MEETMQYLPNRKGEIILYQPDNSLELEVRLEDETVWLNRQQISQLFDRNIKTIGKHINNALREELQEFSVVAKFATTAADGKIYQVEYYNLDMILSVGYRVKSKKGIQFRIWSFASNLIKSAKKAIIIIDNYIDDSILLLLSKRIKGVDATIYTATISPQLQLDLQKYNLQYQPIVIKTFSRSHDRFLFIDNDVYHIGASLKDLGKKWFAFSKMELEAKILLQNII